MKPQPEPFDNPLGVDPYRCPDCGQQDSHWKGCPNMTERIDRIAMYTRHRCAVCGQPAIGVDDTGFKCADHRTPI